MSKLNIVVLGVMFSILFAKPLQARSDVEYCGEPAAHFKQQLFWPVSPAYSNFFSVNDNEPEATAHILVRQRRDHDFVRAMAGGTVVWVNERSYDKNLNTFVYALAVRSEQGLVTIYDLLQGSVLPKIGDTVSQDDTIGELAPQTMLWVQVRRLRKG